MRDRISRLTSGGPIDSHRTAKFREPYKGCTTGRFVFFGGVNTEGSGTAAISFFYALPATRLLRARYSFTADERLRGRVSLRTLITINGSFLSPAEMDFFASFSIRRVVRVFDGDDVVLNITDSVATDASQGNAAMDDFLGETRNTNIDVNAFLTSPFAVSGANDVVIRFDYIFSASAKGSLNDVTFSGAAGNGVFQVRNRGVTLQVDLASVFSNRLLNP